MSCLLGWAVLGWRGRVNIDSRWAASGSRQMSGNGWAALGLGGDTQSGQVKASQDPSWYRCRVALSLCSALAVEWERPLVIVQTMVLG